jgi:hypothetical protein
MPFCPTHIRTTSSGSKVFAERESGRAIRVTESSLKVNGPCVWVFCDTPDGQDSVHLNLEDAQLVVDGLLRFVLDARAQEAEAVAKAR